MPKERPQDDLAIFEIDAEALHSEAAQRARYAGLRKAKQRAQATAEFLAACGIWLLAFILLVSGLHVWETIAAIRPAWVQEFNVPWQTYYVVAALFTVGIDLAALYMMSANNTLAMAGMQRNYYAIGFFLFATFLLNSAFVVRYAIELPVDWKAWLLPKLDMAFVVILPAFIPAALFAIEQARERMVVASLRLGVDIDTLTALSESVEATTNRQDTALQSGSEIASVEETTNAGGFSEEVEARITQVVPLVAAGANAEQVRKHFGWKAGGANWYFKQAERRIKQNGHGKTEEVAG